MGGMSPTSGPGAHSNDAPARPITHRPPTPCLLAPRPMHLYAHAMETWSLVDGRWQPGEIAGASVLWFDVCGFENGDLDALGERFHLHPLAIEDCKSTMVHAPKIDEFSDHLFVVVHAVVPGPEPEEIDIFLGQNFVITYRDRDLPC